MMKQDSLIIRNLGTVDYQETWAAMRSFTEQRTQNTIDELWCLEHPAVFTQGQAGKPEHILNIPSTKTIPIIQTDRGGQVTYHGPGQGILYFLLDIRRKGLGIRAFVSKIEQAVIDMLADYGIAASANVKAPGVYVKGAKIAALGLRIRKGCSYHGLSLNMDMDLGPFQGINPCGFSNLTVVQMKDFLVSINMPEINQKLIQQLCHHLGYSNPNFLPPTRLFEAG